MFRRHFAGLGLAVAGALTLGLMPAATGLSTASAQEAFPTKPIRVIVPFAPGGRTDTVARLLAKKIEEKDLLPQPLVIVNMQGGSGGIAGQATLDAEADGHTILHWHHQFLIAHAMELVPFAIEDFDSIGFAGGGSPVWAVRAESDYATLDDLVTALQAEPRSLVETIGIGTIPHFVGALLANEAGFETRKVQAGGGADRLKMIAGKQADIALFSAAEYLRNKDVAGGLRPLVFFGPNRIDVISEVPTALELGYNVTWANPNWWLAPKGVPADRLQLIADALRQAMDDPEIKEWYVTNALDHYWTDGATAMDESATLQAALDEVAATIK